MITRKKLLLSLLKIDPVSYAILIPLAAYFAYFTGGYTGETATYFLIDVFIVSILAVILELSHFNLRVSR